MNTGAAVAAGVDEDWPEGSAMYVGSKLVESRDYFERLLKQREAELVRLLSKEKDPDARLIAAMQRQQEAWLKYRDDECELVGSLSGAGGTWPSTFAVQCEASLTDRRFRRFGWAVKCWKDIAAEDRRFSAARCPYQLAPLATK